MTLLFSLLRRGIPCVSVIGLVLLSACNSTGITRTSSLVPAGDPLVSSSPDVAPADIAQPILREEGGNNAQAEPASSVHLAQAEMPVDGPASATERDASSESAAPHDGVVSSALPDSGQSDTIELRDVLLSLEASFPLVQAALLEVPLADGKQIAAWGEFDTKLKAASQNGPSGYYQTYRNDMGFVQPLYTGGEVFGGYRIGRGDFQSWDGERQTNNAGEVKAGARIPLVRNRSIDERRADLWRAEYDRDLAQPEVRLQLLSFAMEGSVAYWSWVAAGRKYQIGAAALMVARERNRQLERRVQEGDVDPPVLQDSLRTIAQRESKLIDLGRKVQQSAVKLSLFYRTLDGTPVVPDRCDRRSRSIGQKARTTCDQVLMHSFPEARTLAAPRAVNATNHSSSSKPVCSSTYLYNVAKDTARYRLPTPS